MSKWRKTGFCVAMVLAVDVRKFSPPVAKQFPWKRNYGHSFRQINRRFARVHLRYAHRLVCLLIKTSHNKTFHFPSKQSLLRFFFSKTNNRFFSLKRNIHNLKMNLNINFCYIYGKKTFTAILHQNCKHFNLFINCGRIFLCQEKKCNHY